MTTNKLAHGTPSDSSTDSSTNFNWITSRSYDCTNGSASTREVNPWLLICSVAYIERPQCQNPPNSTPELHNDTQISFQQRRVSASRFFLLFFFAARSLLFFARCFLFQKHHKNAVAEKSTRFVCVCGEVCGSQKCCRRKINPAAVLIPEMYQKRILATREMT